MLPYVIVSPWMSVIAVNRRIIEEFAEIPLFWLYAEAVLNPKYIAEYTFPGIVTGFFTHLEYIKPAP
jgi:hypothetical protein